MDSQTRINDGPARQPVEVESLGSPTAQYRPGVANLVAGIIIGCLLIGGGALVRRMGDEEFGFDGNTLQGHERLGKILRDEARKRDIQWEIVEKRA